jgi:hypothetical protein
LLGGLLQDAVTGAPNDQRWPVSMETAPLHRRGVADLTSNGLLRSQSSSRLTT